MRSAAVALLVLAACAAEPVDDAPDATSYVTEIDESPDATGLDAYVMFVIDTSPAFAPYRENLIANAERFVATMFNGTSVDPSVWIMFVPADSHDGVLAPPMRTDGPILRDLLLADGTRDRNYTGDLSDALADTFTAMFTAADASPHDATSQPIAAAYLALQRNEVALRLEDQPIYRRSVGDTGGAHGLQRIVIATASDDQSPWPTNVGSAALPGGDARLVLSAIEARVTDECPSSQPCWQFAANLQCVDGPGGGVFGLANLGLAYQPELVGECTAAAP
jgi:hypothetical protein